ncbi:MAG: hypothetical protein LH619_11355 [Chitinophagaceae bacterium]|nr:hypothetical protein [Chitinophagaceae bacterium]
MPHLDYSGRAIRFVNRFPVLNGLLTQINFWIIANLILAVLLHFMYSTVNENIRLPLPPKRDPISSSPSYSVLFTVPY